LTALCRKNEANPKRQPTPDYPNRRRTIQTDAGLSKPTPDYLNRRRTISTDAGLSQPTPDYLNRRRTIQTDAGLSKPTPDYPNRRRTIQTDAGLSKPTPDYPKPTPDYPNRRGLSKTDAGLSKPTPDYPNRAATKRSGSPGYACGDRRLLKSNRNSVHAYGTHVIPNVQHPPAPVRDDKKIARPPVELETVGASHTECLYLFAVKHNGHMRDRGAVGGHRGASLLRPDRSPQPIRRLPLRDNPAVAGKSAICQQRKNRPPVIAQQPTVKSNAVRTTATQPDRRLRRTAIPVSSRTAPNKQPPNGSKSSG
jgi:hypothetical protein